ncbi:MAG: NAD(P)/FAD-dependent oxidoreductase [Nitrososphaerota archaeon]|nr:NAD(P)/FAD-dependent oxidoreductase [Nitrososphaerota archaeon]
MAVSERFDTIIVGASFSGLMAARAASKTEKVLLIEKRKQPGTPVNSTGAAPIEWLTKMDAYPSNDCIAGKIRGVEFVGPKGESALMQKSEPDGMVLYPDRYVKWLADRTTDAGCVLLTDTTFKNLEVKRAASAGQKRKEVSSITVSTNRGDFQARYVVGADGAATSVGECVGLGERPAPEDLHVGMEYHLENHNIQNPDFFRLYLGHELAPLGYAWSFPEGKDYLKVGVGIPQSMGVKPKVYMDRFFEKYPQFKTKIVKSNGGIIPTAPPLKTAVKDNILLVGDAAHFCSPLHGGGIWFGMQSGYLAGNAISEHKPMIYDTQWKEQLGGVLLRHYKLKKVIYSMSDKNFDNLISLLKKFSEVQTENRGLLHAAQKIFFSDPSFVFDMALKWMKYGLTIATIKRVVVPGFRIA